MKPYQNPTNAIDERVADLLGQMTLEEKLAQLNAVWSGELCENGAFNPEKARARLGELPGNWPGIGQITRPAGSSAMTPEQTAQLNNAIQQFLRHETRLGIPALIHEECLSGFMARQATIFPQAISLASTWDAELVEAVSQVIATQIMATGGRQGLAPVLDVTRDPRWGRVEETFGEDPYLVARIGTAYVRGLQGPTAPEQLAFSATGKHFAAHGMPEGGLNWAPVHVGERELREVYLFPFEAAVKEAGLASMMNAYHEIDGMPCAANRRLLTGILRNEWGFDGIVVSDYNAIVMLADYHHVAQDKVEAASLAIQAGIEIELPSMDCYGKALMEAVQRGVVDMPVIDEAVRRVLRIKFRLGLFEAPLADEGRSIQAFGRAEFTALARRAAQESLVLLKNQGALLPLSPEIGSIAVIGPNAHSIRCLCGDYSYAAFSEIMGGAAADPVQAGGAIPPGDLFPDRYPAGMLSIAQALEQRVRAGTVVRHARGVGGPAALEEALEAARKSDVALVVVGGKSGLSKEATAGELRDRASLGLMGEQTALVKAIAATGTKVILVVVDGRPAALAEVVDQVDAILMAWLPGEEGAPAIAEAILGEINPSGKLPISFPRSAGQIPIYAAHKPSGGQSYNFIDYVDESVQALFAFGHGLSYTCFEYRDLSITPQTGGMLGEVEVSCKVANCGACEGEEVVQLYLHDVLASLTRPVLELKGFQRVHLEAGESCQVQFRVNPAQLGFYNLSMDYVVEPGVFEVMLGSASNDIRLSGRFELSGETIRPSHKVFFSKSSCTAAWRES